VENKKDLLTWLFAPAQIIRLVLSVTIVLFIVSMMIGMES
jgi:hypothetical protein